MSAFIIDQDEMHAVVRVLCASGEASAFLRREDWRASLVLARMNDLERGSWEDHCAEQVLTDYDAAHHQSA
jgi:hypothetical protein